jgi:hypothetical protein
VILPLESVQATTSTFPQNFRFQKPPISGLILAKLKLLLIIITPTLLVQLTLAQPVPQTSHLLRSILAIVCGLSMKHSSRAQIASRLDFLWAQLSFWN